MDRAHVLPLLDVARQRGLEVGPLDKPMIPRSMGPVEYIDRASRADLQAWYAPNSEVDVEQIVEIDHVWGEQSLLDCVGGHRAYDYLLASHVIEHVPDLFGWLGEIAAVLVDGGLGVFVTPDKRYTFDILRRTSSGGELVDAYVRGLRRPDARQIFDHFYNFRDLGAAAVQHGANPADLAPQHPPRELLELCRKVQASGEYIDTHCWVFTPRSMLEALDLGSRLGLLPFEIAHLKPTAPGSHEFLLALRRLPDGMDPAAQRAAFVASAAALAPLPPEATEGDAETASAALARVAAMEASTSWKITAPLRAVVTFARRLGGRPG